MPDSYLVFLPSLVIFAVMIITKKPVPSLFSGICVIAILLSDSLGVETLMHLWSFFQRVFYHGSQLQWDNIFIMLFLLFLGIFTSLLTISGAMCLIARSLARYIRSRSNSKIAVFIMGVLVFIDDYFSILIVGASMQSLCKHNNVSKEKLAYYLDGTGGPVSALVPFSSWGIFIVGILNESMSGKDFSFASGMDLFSLSIVFNFYSIIAIAMLLLFCFWNYDFPAMRRFEERVRSTENISPVVQNENLKYYAGPVSIISLFAVSTIALFVTGYLRCNEYNLLTILSQSMLGVSLLLGSVFSVAMFLILSPQSTDMVGKSIKGGVKVMYSAIQILVLAWAFSGALAEIKMGERILDVLSVESIDPRFLPLFSFIVAMVMSIMTGSSWIIFSIVIPLICQICIGFDDMVLVASIGAIIAGGVSGDHLSPISDSTILSATAAGCNHYDHVKTQLPYCVIGIIISILLYTSLGFFYL